MTIPVGSTGELQPDELHVVHARAGGLDVHKMQITALVRVCEPGGGVECAARQFSALPEGLAALTDWLAGQRVTAAAMEGTGIFWSAPFEALEDAGIEPLLLHAQFVKQVKGRKSDVADSLWLAGICQFGLCRPSYVPPSNLRQLSRYRRKLVDECSRARNRIHKTPDPARIPATSAGSPSPAPPPGPDPVPVAHSAHSSAGLFGQVLARLQGRLGRPAADPYTRTPYPNGDVPQSVMTPFSQRVLSDLPAPNRPGLGNNFESLPGDDTDDKKGGVKIDHYFSERATAFVRFSRRRFNRFQPDEIPGPSGGDSNQNVGAFNQSFAGGVTYTLNPSSLLEFRLAFIRSEGGKTPVNFDGPHVEDEYGITGVARDERIGGGLNSHEVRGFNDFGRQTSNPQFQDPDNWNPRLNYSTTKGNHSFKLGYEHQRIDTDINDLSPVYGRSRYGGRFSTPPGESSNNIHNLGDFFVGAQSTLEMSRFVVLEYRQRMHFFHVQDDWKVSPNLTLNLGARYEYASPQWENRNRLGNFDPDTNSLVFARDGSISDRALVDPDLNNWAPRVGLAYRLNPKTVIRSGYGVSYIHFNRMGGENILGFTGPFVFRRTQNQAPPSSLPLCSPGQPGQNLSTCFTRTQYGFTPDFLADETYDPSISRVNFQPRDTRSGYVQSWHFTVQRELARDLALDVAYVGNRGAKQLILTDFNQARPNGPDENLSIDNRRPIPGFTHIQMSFSGGNTFYHAFQAKLEKRFSRGLYVLNSFTWSKAIDNAAGHLETFNGDRSRINFLDQKSERGLSSYDIPLNNVTSIIWEIPFGTGRRYGSGMSGVANAVLGGWRTTVINSARSGNTINIYYSPSSRARVCGACYTRPNVVGTFQSPDQNPHDYFINDNIVIPPFTAPFGNLGRNMGRAPGLAQLDFGLHKDFALPREGSRVEFRAEFFNLFNRTNFRAPQSRRDASSFGRITSTFPAREAQFALKLYF